MDDLGDFIVFDTFLSGGSASSSRGSRRGSGPDDNFGCGCWIVFLIVMIILLYIIFS
jgi:hypothetical protein